MELTNTDSGTYVCTEETNYIQINYIVADIVSSFVSLNIDLVKHFVKSGALHMYYYVEKYFL